MMFVCLADAKAGFGTLLPVPSSGSHDYKFLSVSQIMWQSSHILLSVASLPHSVLLTKEPEYRRSISDPADHETRPHDILVLIVN